MIPPWASIHFIFDQEKVKNEILNSGALNKMMIATSDATDSGHSVWDPEGKFFSEDQFKKHSSIPYYKTDSATGLKNLVPGQINTFNMLNLTYIDSEKTSLNDAWKGDLKDKSRKPLWILNQHPWRWRNDLDLPFTKEVISQLPFEYLLTVRCIVQVPPSIGVVHKDNSYASNQEFYKTVFGSITLNISSGGANLYFINHLNSQKHKVNEDRYTCWHFDDSHLHCTDEVKTTRIQIRVFGKLNTD